MQGDYIATTMIMGMAKIIPVILFVVAGWFVFIKLPFLFFLKTLRESKGIDQFGVKDYKWQQTYESEYKPEYSINNYEAFLRKSRRAKEAEERELKSQQSSSNIEFERFERQESAEEKANRAQMNEKRKKYAEEMRAKAQELGRKRQEQKEKERQERERASRDQYARQEREQAERQKRANAERSGHKNPEAIFKINPGESLSQDELKKRYRELIKANHPDKVASEGTQVRSLAEKKTKEINSAYEALKAKAA